MTENKSAEIKIIIIILKKIYENYYYYCTSHILQESQVFIKTICSTVWGPTEKRSVQSDNRSMRKIPYHDMNSIRNISSDRVHLSAI